jgi:hypothetical protein
MASGFVKVAGRKGAQFPRWCPPLVFLLAVFFVKVLAPMESLGAPAGFFIFTVCFVLAPMDVIVALYPSLVLHNVWHEVTRFEWLQKYVRLYWVVPESLVRPKRKFLPFWS